MFGLSYPPPTLLSGSLLAVTLYLLTHRLRGQGVDEWEVRAIVGVHRGMFEKMSRDEITSRYLTELSVHEMTGPH